MAISRSQMKRQLYSIGGGAIKGTDAGNGREGFFRPVPGSPTDDFLKTLQSDDPRNYGIGFGGGFGPRQPRPMVVSPQGGEQAIYPRLGSLTSGVSAAEQELQQINQSIDQVQSTLGESSGGPQGQLVGGASKVPALTDIYAEAQKSAQDKRAGGFMGRIVLPGEMSFKDFSNIYNVGGFQAGPLGSSPMSSAMRSMAAGGGIMNAVPRENYGLGSFVKSVGKAVKGVAKGVKDFAKSDVGKAALLAGGAYYLGGGNLFGLQRAGLSTPGFALTNLPGAGFFTKAAPGVLPTGPRELGLATRGLGIKKALGTTAAISGLTGFLASQGMEEEEIEAVKRDPELLSNYLGQYYKNLNPEASPQDVANFVRVNTLEYKADGGRIGYQDGTPKEGIETLTPMKKPDGDVQYVRDMIKSLDGFAQLIAQKNNLDRQTFQNHMDLFEDFRQRKDIDPMPAYTYLKRRVQELNPEVAKMIYITQEDNPNKTTIEKPKMAYGGRMGYALGDRAEDNAMQASNAMGLPLNQNPAGVTELDLRETGGFIPPVGVKEKADDIPAMLSNNEFVFTADAVRGMGDGDVNKGAQRMYDMMKKLENGGRV